MKLTPTGKKNMKVIRGLSFILILHPRAKLNIEISAVLGLRISLLFITLNIMFADVELLMGGMLTHIEQLKGDKHD